MQRKLPRLLVTILCVLAFGCGDPSAKAPMLTLKVIDSDGKSRSIGRYRVFVESTLSESGDTGSDGSSQQQRIAVEEIAEDGVKLIFEFSESSDKPFTKKFHVAYGGETKVELPNESTLVATLEAQK